ncbi:MAG: hypothetical protein KA204_03900 [Chromatiaceae bacterium]|nr:hypothetical protein [Chromatiaceae bacterium]
MSTSDWVRTPSRSASSLSGSIAASVAWMAEPPSAGEGSARAISAGLQ